MNDLNSKAADALDIDFTLDSLDPAQPESEAAALAPPQPEHSRNLALFSRIPVTLTLEVASVEITLAELINVGSDSVIELDKLAGEALDVKVNGVLFGTAEVVVLNDKYGLRLIDFNNKELGELAQ